MSDQPEKPVQDDTRWLAMVILRGLELICSGIRKRYGIEKIYLDPEDPRVAQYLQCQGNETPARK